MADLGRLDELKRKFDENPRRYFAPLANEFRKVGDTERAIELCRTYLPQQPNHMSGYIVYGQALHDAGRSDEATAVFKQALSLDPENIIALRHLGEIAESSGDKAAAMRWFGKVLELDPRNEEIAGYITHLATPGSAAPARTPPPAVRPEPEHDPAAVALADVLRQPDRPRIARFEPPRVSAPETKDRATSLENEEHVQSSPDRSFEMPQAPVLDTRNEQGTWDSGDDHQHADESVSEENQARPHVGGHSEEAGVVAGQHDDPSSVDSDNVNDGDAAAFEALDWTAVTSYSAKPEAEDDSTIGAIGPNGRMDRDELVSHVADEEEAEPLATGATADDLEHNLSGWGDEGSSALESRAEEPEPRTMPDSPFVTETMAELYVQQGLDGDALVIYRQLALARNDDSLSDKIAELEERLSSETPARAGFGSRYDREMENDADEPPSAHGADADASAPAAHAIGETVREFFARIGSAHLKNQSSESSGVRGVNDSGAVRGTNALDALFGDRPNAGDIEAAESLAGAFGSPSQSRHA